MSPLVAGVDCWTQATKVLVVDSDGGEVVAEGRAPHDVCGRAGARETDPEQWWEALAGALALTKRAGEVQAIAVAGQQHGLVMTGSDGRPLRPAILWNDTRSAAEATALRSALGGPSWWAEEIGVVPVPSFTATRWAWRERRARCGRRRRARCACPHDCAHRAPLWPRRHRPRRCVGHRLVVHPDEPTPTRCSSTCGSTARCCPGARPRRASPARSTPRRRAAGPAEGALVVPAPATTWAPRSGWARPRRAGGQPRHVGAPPTRGKERAVDPSGTVRGLRRRRRRLPAARRDAQRPPRPSTASPSGSAWTARPRRSEPRRWCFPTSTESEPPTSPARPGRPACVTGRPVRRFPAGRLRRAASLVEALDELARQGSGLDPGAPLILIEEGLAARSAHGSACRPPRARAGRGRTGGLGAAARLRPV